MSQLSFLCYRSRSELSDQDSQEASVEVAASGGAFNKERGVTGLLIYRGGYFLQLLEGPQEALDEVFDRICADGRHRELRLLAKGEAQSRLYPEWSMKALSAEEIDKGILGSFLTDIESSRDELNQVELKKLMDIFEHYSSMIKSKQL